MPQISDPALKDAKRSSRLGRNGGYLASLLLAVSLGLAGTATAATAAEESAACRKNLEVIYQAIQAFQKDHHDLPNWLSDLVPDYLSDVTVLTCPVCRRTGKVEAPPLADPKMPTSYLFEFCPVSVGNMAPNAKNKTRRDWKRRQMELVGPIVPVVRCRHHTPVLNLASDGRIYESPPAWETLLTNQVGTAELSAARLFANESPPAQAKTRNYPPRDPTARRELLDLSAFYNALPSESWHGGTGNDLAGLPTGLQSFGGIDFDVRALVQLGSKSPSGSKFPLQVKGIKVQQSCRQLHFLHSAGWGSVADEGKQVGSYVVHFAGDQTRLEIPILYGRDVRNWHVLSGEPAAPEELKVVWTGENAVSKRAGKNIRLFLTTWTNLIPNLAIESVDVVSSQAIPALFVLAITADPL